MPGHGPLCGIEGVKEMRAYLEFVRNESRKCFDDGISSLEAAKRIDLGPYADWKAPARLSMNVERAYREFRGKLPMCSVPPRVATCLGRWFHETQELSDNRRKSDRRSAGW